MGGYSADYIKALVSYSDESVQYKLTDLVGTSASVLGGWMITVIPEFLRLVIIDDFIGSHAAVQQHAQPVPIAQAVKPLHGIVVGI